MKTLRRNRILTTSLACVLAALFIGAVGQDFYTEEEIKVLEKQVSAAPDDYEALFKLADAYVTFAGVSSVFDKYPLFTLI